MKILIGFLLALFISGQAYAQSATEIITKGEVLSTSFNPNNDRYDLAIIYKNKIYACSFYDDHDRQNLFCREIKEN